MRLNWKLCDNSSGCKVYRTRFDQFECRLLDYGESQSYSIHKVGASIDALNKLVVSSDISSMGLPNTKLEIQEVLACIMNNVSPYPRTMALDRFKFYPEHLNVRANVKVVSVRGHVIDGIYSTPFSKDYYKLTRIANVSPDAVLMELSAMFYFINIVYGDHLTLTASDINRLKLHRVTT